MPFAEKRDQRETHHIGLADDDALDARVEPLGHGLDGGDIGGGKPAL